MRRLSYTKVNRIDKLADELNAAGVAPAQLLLCQAAGDAITIAVDDAVAQATVDAAVAAHNPATYDAQDTQAATRRQQDIDVAKQYLALAPGTATLAQTQAAAQAIIRLLRDQYVRLQ